MNTPIQLFKNTTSTPDLSTMHAAACTVNNLLSTLIFGNDTVSPALVLPEGQTALATPLATPPKNEKKVRWVDDVRNEGKKSVRFACHDEAISPPRYKKEVRFACEDEIIPPQKPTKKVRFAPRYEVIMPRKVVKKIRFACEDEIIPPVYEKRVGFACVDEVIMPLRLLKPQPIEDGEKPVKKVRFACKDQIIPKRDEDEDELSWFTDDCSPGYEPYAKADYGGCKRLPALKSEKFVSRRGTYLIITSSRFGKIFGCCLR